jgi:hypothetical protein
MQFWHIDLPATASRHSAQIAFWHWKQESTAARSG